MCKYCDVQMPDGCGMELHGEKADTEVCIYPDGMARFYGNAPHMNLKDTFRFKYCPMCGKPLGDTPQDEDTIYFVQDFNYDGGYYPAYFDKEDAIDHAEEVIKSDDERERCNVLTARVIKKDTCKLAIT